MITENYLDLPKRLVISTHDNVLAPALYLLIARLFLATGGEPVPLSRGDAQRYDPTLTEGGFRRAIKRLVTAGWLIQSGSYKGTYIPSWGRRRDAASSGPYTKWEVYPWMVGEPLLGCPRHIAAEAIRVDRDLLDVFVGRLIPDARFVCIERYLTKPLLSLANIGAYIAARGGFAIDEQQAKALARWGLWHDGQPVIVPPGEREVLALVSQRASIDGPQLTEAGWRKLGWPVPTAAPAPPQAGVAPATLIFVAKDQAAYLAPPCVGGHVTSGDEGETCFSASIAAESAQAPERATMTGNQSDPSDPREILPLPPHAPSQPAGGGCSPSTRHKSFPDTAAARLLAEIGCYPSSIAELAGMPVEQVGGAVAYARSQPNITSVAAWTVDALRRMRDEGWTLPSEGTPGAGAGQVERWSAERAAQIAGGWGDLFRLGSDTSDLETDVRCKISGRAGMGADLEGEGAAPPAAQADPQGRAAPPEGTPTAPGWPNEIGTESNAKDAHHNVATPPGQARVAPGVTPAPDRAMCSNGTETLTEADRSNRVMYNAKGAPGAAPVGGPPAGPGDAEGARAYVLGRQAREELRRRCDRGHHNTIAGLQIQSAGNRTIVTCANRADRSTVSGVLIGALRQVVKELGLPTELEIVVQAAPPVATHRWATEPQGGMQ